MSAQITQDLEDLLDMTRTLYRWAQEPVDFVEPVSAMLRSAPQPVLHALCERFALCTDLLDPKMSTTALRFFCDTTAEYLWAWREGNEPNV